MTRALSRPAPYARSVRHVESHPEPVEGCFGCKALTVGALMASSASNGTLTKTVTDDHGTHQVDVTQHWGDRQDVMVRPPTVAGQIPYELTTKKATASKDPELRNRLNGIFT